MDNLNTVLQGIEEWSWIGWLVLIALFLVIEMLTLDFTFLMLALGSGFGLASDLTGLPIWAQVIIAALAAAALILLLRPPLLRRLHRHEDPTKSNIDAIVGLHGTVLLQVTSLTGQVKLSNGDTWTARAVDGGILSPGTPVSVVSIEGATAHVRPTAHEE